MNFNCSYQELLSIDDPKIIPNPKNNNRHSIEQIKRLAKIIDYQGQRSPIVISKLTGFVVKGHCRLQAIKELGWSQIAVDFQDYISEAQEYADMTADNEIARWAELDIHKTITDLQDIDLGDIDLLGFENSDFLADKLDIKSLELEDDEIYTRKVESPQYKITGELPKFEEIYDMAKTKELVENIKQSNISDDVKDFLIAAAHRHTKFNYRNIAEFYAHQDKDVQKLMEDSALIIIDFNDAIENGFVKLTEQMRQEYLND